MERLYLQQRGLQFQLDRFIVLVLRTAEPEDQQKDDREKDQAQNRAHTAPEFLRNADNHQNGDHDVHHRNKVENNPPDRFARNLPLAKGDQSTYYGGGREGYTDYPVYGAEAAE